MSDNYLKLLFEFRLWTENKTVLIVVHKFTQATNQMQFNKRLINA